MNFILGSIHKDNYITVTSQVDFNDLPIIIKLINLLIMTTKYKTTPREKTIIKLMEMVIDTLKYCDDLDDPAFAMYDVMKDAVEKEVRYPMEF